MPVIVTGNKIGIFLLIADNYYVEICYKMRNEKI